MQFFLLSIIISMLISSTILIIYSVFMSYFTPKPWTFVLHVLVAPPLFIYSNFPLCFNYRSFLLSSTTFSTRVPFYWSISSYELLLNIQFTLFALFLSFTSLFHAFLSSHSSLCVLLGLLGLIFLSFLFFIQLRHAEFCMVCCVFTYFFLFYFHALAWAVFLFFLIIHSTLGFN